MPRCGTGCDEVLALGGRGRVGGYDWRLDEWTVAERVGDETGIVFPKETTVF